MNINKKSWHYYIVNKWAEKRDWQINDLCSYLRAIGLGLLRILLVGIVLGFVSFIGISLVAGFIYSIYLYSTGNLAIIPEWAKMGFVAGSCLIILLTVASGWVVVSELFKRNKNKSSENPGVLSLLYRKFHDKTCYKIDFIED